MVSVMNLSVVRPCTLAEYRHRRTVTPLRGVDAYASEEQQKQRWLEARERLNPKPPKPQPLLEHVPVVSEPVIAITKALRFFVQSCEDITDEKTPVEIVESFWTERRKSWKDIVNEVCEKHGVSFNDLVSHRRPRIVYTARHEAYYRLREETSYSLPHIAKLLGRCDHSVVMHGIKMFKERNGIE